MSADGNPQADVVPAEVSLLLFHAGGVAMGVEAAAIEEILDAEQARRSGLECRGLTELLGAVGTAAAPTKHLLLKGRTARCAIGIDGLDEILTVPTRELQPLPEPLSHSRGPRRFWAGLVRAERIVLLVDVERLQEPSPTQGEALL